MEIAEVVDRESLEAYLNGLPDETDMATARFVAFQSGARVAPIALRFFAENGHADVHAARVLPIWASLAIQKIALDTSTGSLSKIAIADAARALDHHPDYAGNHSTDVVADATVSVGNGSFSAAAIAEADDYYTSTVIHAVSGTVAYAANAVAQAAPHVSADFWSFVRDDLKRGRAEPDQPLWLDAGVPDTVLSEWRATCAAFDADKSGTDWTFWTMWYERILAGKDIYADRLAPIVNQITLEQWVVYPARVNARFDEVLAVYQADDAQVTSGPTPRDKAWREVVNLQGFIDTEYALLTERRHSSAAENDVLDALENLKVFVDFMLGRLEEASGEGDQATILKNEIWPTVANEVNKLAKVETDPRIRSTILTMLGASDFAAGIRPELKAATTPVLDGAAIQTPASGWRRFFPFNKQSGSRS